MQRKYFISLGLSALTTIIAFTSSISPSFSQMIIGNLLDTSSDKKAQNPQSDTVTFMCKEIFDAASEKNIPATVAWVPKRQGHIRLIGWKSEYFPTWSPEKRCEAVTKNFQKYYDEGRLDYLSTGKRDGYPVICVAKQGETCTKDNHLFTIKHGYNPQIVLQQLININEGKSGEPLYQSSGKELHVEVKNIFDNAPLVKVED